MKRLLPILGLFFLLAIGAAGQRGMPPQEGIANFGKINDNLYRGAQPDTAAIVSLKRFGVKTIINLRMPGDTSKTETAEAQANGILYTNLPMSGISRPTDEQVNKALALIENLPAPVFVHCEHGCDRTGTIIACYRIRHDQWSNDSALREAEQYGLSKLERGMRRFIADFGKRRIPNAGGGG
jgi:protein tyrosine/serine phosphatase